jgi:alanine racemase
VTDIPPLSVGAWLDLIGPGGVDALAQDAGTNGYEILTSLGRRYQRIYR